MSREDSDSQDEQGPGESQVFCCYAPDLRPLAILLSTVHFSARAIIQISHSSLHVEVEVGKILQAHAYLEKSAFTAWHFNPPAVANSQRERAQDSDAEDGHSKHSEEEEEDSMAEVRFEVSMSSLIECLNVFGTASSQKTYTKHFVDHEFTADHSPGHPPKRKYGDESNKSKGWPSKARKLPTSAVRISYDGEGHPLVLLIEDSGVVTRCSLMTYEADELAQMDFPVERQLVHLIMKSDWLKSAFSQFDEKSGSEISFMFTPSPSSTTIPNKPEGRRPVEQEGGEGANRPTFRMEVDGELGCYTVDFPNDKDILDSFMCKIPDGLDPHDWNHLGFVRNSYKLSHILKIKKALDVSSKTVGPCHNFLQLKKEAIAIS